MLPPQAPLPNDRPSWQNLPGQPRRPSQKAHRHNCRPRQDKPTQPTTCKGPLLALTCTTTECPTPKLTTCKAHMHLAEPASPKAHCLHLPKLLPATARTDLHAPPFVCAFHHRRDNCLTESPVPLTRAASQKARILSKMVSLPRVSQYKCRSSSDMTGLLSKAIDSRSSVCSSRRR